MWLKPRWRFLTSTQVLEDRGEMGSRHGRAIFSVLLLQDLAVVVLLMLIPLLARTPDGSSGGMYGSHRGSPRHGCSQSRQGDGRER